MNFDAILQNHLDGTLGDADQAELFHILAVSDEKRASYNEYVRLRNMLSTDRAAGKLPAILSDNTLHAALLMTPPVAAPALLTGVASMKAILPIAIACAITVGGWIGYSIGSSRNVAPVSAAAQSNPVSIENQNPIRASGTVKSELEKTNSAGRHGILGLDRHTAPVHSSPSSSNIESALLPPVAIITRDSEQTAVRKQQDDHIGAFAVPVSSHNDPSHTPTTSLTSNDIRFASLSLPIQHVSPYEPLNAIVTDEPAQFEIDLTQGACVAQSSINAANLPTPPTLSLIGFHAGMRVGEHTFVGVMGAQNSFALSYSDQPTSSTITTYSQYSTLLYGGIYGRQEFNLASAFIPSVMLGAAGSTLGAIAEMEVRVAHPLRGSIHAFAGVHSNILFYRHVGTWFQSQTTSIVAGIGVGL